MEPIVLSSKAGKQVREFFDEARKLDERLNVYVAGIAAALDVPPNWQLNVEQMAFLPPQAPEDNAQQPADDPE